MATAHEIRELIAQTTTGTLADTFPGRPETRSAATPSTVARRERRGRRSPERRPWHSAESCMIEDLGLL
jgi:hypothetical protein